MAERIKTEDEKLFEERHPNLTKLNNYIINNRIKSYTILTFGFVIPIAVLWTYLNIAVTTGDYNPLTQLKTFTKQGERYRSEIKRLNDLRSRVMRKAESVDGLAGLTFIEQAMLAKSLGYTGDIVEGNSRRIFNLRVSGDKKIILETETRTNGFECSEESLEKYLGE